MGSLYLGGPTIQEVNGKMMMGLSIYWVPGISGSLYSRFYGIRKTCAREIKYTCTCIITRNATALGSLIRPRAVTRCNLAVSDMYMRDFGKTHRIAYTNCSVGISDLKPLTGTSADQLPHRKSQSLATA